MEWSERKKRLRRFLRDPDGTIWSDALLLRLYNDEQTHLQNAASLLEDVQAVRVPPRFELSYMHDWEWEYTTPSRGYVYQCFNIYDQAQLVFCYWWETEFVAGGTSDTSDSGNHFTHPWEAFITTPGDAPPLWCPKQFQKILAVYWDKKPLEPTTKKELTQADRTWRTRTGEPQKYRRLDVLENFISLYPIPSSVVWDDIDGDEETGGAMGDADTGSTSIVGGSILIGRDGDDDSVAGSSSFTAGADVPDMPSDSDLVLYYKLDEATGATASDEKGLYDGTCVNTDNNDWVTGQTNNGLRLQKTSDFVGHYIDIGDPLQTTSRGSHSFSFWASLTEGRRTANGQYFYGVDAGSNHWIFIFINSSGTLIVRYAEGTNFGNWKSASHVFASGAVSMFHLAVVIESGVSIRVYKDNALISADASWNGDMSDVVMASYTSILSPYIGAIRGSGYGPNGYLYPLDGVVDEFRIYKIALTASNVEALYNNDL